jgi:hypothetical protein
MPRGDGTGPRGKGPGTGRGAGGCAGSGIERTADAELSGRLTAAGSAFGPASTGRGQNGLLTLGRMLGTLFERLSRK